MIEVGSGWSSALEFDVCAELRARGAAAPRLDFIEPAPTRRRELLRAGDEQSCTMWERETPMLAERGGTGTWLERIQ